MNRITFLTDLAALPLRITVFVYRIIRKPLPAGLLKVLWKISRQREDGVLYFSSLYQEGPEQVRHLADTLLEEMQDCFWVADLCALDFFKRRDRDYLVQHIHRARDKEYSNPEILSYLELLMLDVKEHPQQIFEHCEILLSRRDLAPNIAHLTYYNLILYHIIMNQTAQAQSLIKRMLALGENLDFRILNMALSMRTGKDDIKEQMKKIRRKDKNWLYFSLALASYYGEKSGDILSILKECSPDFLRQIHHHQELAPYVDALLKEGYSA